MKNHIILFLLFINNSVFGQNQAFYVKQTQISMDSKEFKPLLNNPIFEKITFKENGIEFLLYSGQSTLIEKNKVDKVDLDDGAFRYELKFGNKMDVVLFFTPYPNKSNQPQFIMAIVSISGLVVSDPNQITFYRLVFKDELILN